MMILVMQPFGPYMRQLRKQRGLTLKEVEAGAEVSNAYVSQIERGLRRPPHPEILKRLAKVYQVQQRDLLVAAGYLEEESPAQMERRKVEETFEHAVSDPKFKHGMRLKGTRVSFETKRFIVEMYQQMMRHDLQGES